MKTLIWRGLWDARHPSWEHLDLAPLQAESQLRACDEHGHPFQLDYALSRPNFRRRLRISKSSTSERPPLAGPCLMQQA